MLTTQQAPNVEASGPPRRRWRALRWVLASVLVLVAAGVLVLWWLNRPPAPVSVNDVLNRFRNTSPSAAPVAGGPRIGVYLYATRGSERVSAGNVTHHYPKITTLTVTTDSCGLKFRWDALAGRYGEWRVCRSGSTWSLDHYTDVHTFLYMKDVHDYTCSGFPVVVCRTDSGVLTSSIARIGPESVVVGGSSRRATHLRITQTATGKSISTGTIDVWVLPSGLPARVAVDNRGAQTILGSRVTYQERATFTLTSATPRR